MIRVSPETALEVLDDRAVLLHLPSGRFFRLNPAATLMWQLLGETGDPAQVLAGCLASFDVPEIRLQADLTRFVDDLIEAGLAEVVSAAHQVDG